MPATPFGANPIAATQLGNAVTFTPQASHAHRQTGRLGITYTIGPHSGVALGITYKVQGKITSSLGIQYQIVPKILQCAINGNTNIPSPETIVYIVTDPQYDLSGRPTTQGYLSMAWNWSVMTNSELGSLMALYVPSNPQVSLTYPTQAGEWVTNLAMMQPPNLGTRTTTIHSNVSFTFTHLPLRN